MFIQCFSDYDKGNLLLLLHIWFTMSSEPNSGCHCHLRWHQTHIGRIWCRSFEGKKLWNVSSKIELTDEKDSKYEESESDIGKISKCIATSLVPSIKNQLAKFNHPKNDWDYLAWLYGQTNWQKRMAQWSSQVTNTTMRLWVQKK